MSGDNKGYASYLFEKEMNGWSTLSGRGPFVAAFGQSNEGDVSPNVKGAYCLFPASVKGQPCDFEHSTCAGRNEGCQGQGIGCICCIPTAFVSCYFLSKGPDGLEMFMNTRAIGFRQYDFASKLFQNASVVLNGGDFKSAMTYVDMSNVTIDPKFTISGKTGDQMFSFFSVHWFEV